MAVEVLNSQCSKDSIIVAQVLDHYAHGASFIHYLLFAVMLCIDHLSHYHLLVFLCVR